MAELPSAWKIYNAVCACTDESLTHYEVAILMLLARYADPGGGNVHPKQRTIASTLRIGLITVTRTITNLRRKGYLEVEYEQRGFVTHYRFVLAKLGLDEQIEEQPKNGNAQKFSSRNHVEKGPISEDTHDFERENGQKSEIREISEEEIARLLQRVRDYDHAKIHRPEVAAMWKTGAESARQRLAEAGVQV